MKRIICLITALCIVLGSFSFCFASATSWDTSDQANLQAIKNTLTSSGSSTVLGIISTISSRLVWQNKGTAQLLAELSTALYDNGGSGTVHSIGYWLADIDYGVQRIMNAVEGTTQGSIGDTLNKILNSLVYSDAAGAVKSWLADVWQTNAVLLDLDNVNGFTNTRNNGNFTYNVINGFGTYQSTAYNGRSYNWREALLFFVTESMNNDAREYRFTTQAYGNGYNSTQHPLDWETLSTTSFTPLSIADGLYNWLSNIQAPVARLSYVLASDERIEAQEAAAANEDAVVDNFIDSSGAGSASPSDIGSISDLSSGYKSNFGSDASVSGIFNIFNSNNMGWFSQETANQLDTTTNSRRGSSFDTPLLDQQIEDIYDQIGVKHD